MRNILHSAARREREQRSAVDVFLAALPDHRGRVLTTGSDIDSWRHKHPEIVQRLKTERQWR